MLGKLVEGQLIQASENEYRKVVVTNPTEEQLKYLFGYKDVVVETEPEYNTETQHLEPYYEEDENTIGKHWNVVDNPVEEEINI